MEIDDSRRHLTADSLLHSPGWEERKSLEQLRQNARSDFAEINREPSCRAQLVFAAERKVPNLFLLCCRVNVLLKGIHDSRIDFIGHSITLALGRVADE